MGYVENTAAVLREKAGKELAAKIARDTASFPRGPAGRSVVLTHMKNSGYSAEHIAEAKEILESAGVK